MKVLDWKSIVKANVVKNVSKVQNLRKFQNHKQTIKGPDNPTSQLLPKMSFNGFSRDGEGRKDKGGGERSRR